MDEEEKSDALQFARSHGAEDGGEYPDDKSAEFQLFEGTQTLQVDTLGDG